MPAQTQDSPARVLTEEFFSKLRGALPTHEKILPGISEQIIALIDPKAIEQAFSVAVAKELKASVDRVQAGDLSLADMQKETEAVLGTIRALRSLLLSGGSANLAEAKELMGNKMVGPDARIFEGKDLGEIPALPANIMEILNSKCDLSNDGRRVADTHRLVLVPASIDGKPLTLNALRELATEAVKGKDPSFYGQDWYDNEAFANKPLEKSTWVLEYQTVAPKSENKTDAQQVALVEKLPNHRTAKILER
jgi:hypothetical protein